MTRFIKFEFEGENIPGFKKIITSEWDATTEDIIEAIRMLDTEVCRRRNEDKSERV